MLREKQTKKVSIWWQKLESTWTEYNVNIAHQNAWSENDLEISFIPKDLYLKGINNKLKKLNSPYKIFKRKWLFEKSIETDNLLTK